MDQHINQSRVVGLEATALPTPGPGILPRTTGMDSEGRLALIETCEQRGSGPPLHRHSREDELIFVLGGRVTFQIEGELYHGDRGTCAVLRQGSEHSYVVESDEARLLIVLVPAGFEECLGEMSQVLYGAPPEHESEVGQDVERLIATFARYGVEITGQKPERQTNATTVIAESLLTETIHDGPPRGIDSSTFGSQPADR